MPNQRPPLPPSKQLPVNYQPPNSIRRAVGGASGPPGRLDDTWESVARDYNLDVKQLIRFNFHTDIPEEVNWYLHRNVGCNTPSLTGRNWTFKGAKPGIIYIPITKIDMDEEQIEGSPGVEETDWEYDKHESINWIKEILSAVDYSHIAAELMGLHLGLFGEFLGGAGAYWMALELLELT